MPQSAIVEGLLAGSQIAETYLERKRKNRLDAFDMDMQQKRYGLESQRVTNDTNATNSDVRVNDSNIAQRNRENDIQDAAVFADYYDKELTDIEAQEAAHAERTGKKYGESPDQKLMARRQALATQAYEKARSNKFVGEQFGYNADSMKGVDDGVPFDKVMPNPNGDVIFYGNGQDGSVSMLTKRRVPGSDPYTVNMRDIGNKLKSFGLNNKSAGITLNEARDRSRAERNYNADQIAGLEQIKTQTPVTDFSAFNFTGGSSGAVPSSASSAHRPVDTAADAPVVAAAAPAQTPVTRTLESIDAAIKEDEQKLQAIKDSAKTKLAADRAAGGIASIPAYLNIDVNGAFDSKAANEVAARLATNRATKREADNLVKAIGEQTDPNVKAELKTRLDSLLGGAQKDTPAPGPTNISAERIAQAENDVPPQQIAQAIFNGELTADQFNSLPLTAKYRGEVQKYLQTVTQQVEQQRTFDAENFAANKRNIGRLIRGGVTPTFDEAIYTANTGYPDNGIQREFIKLQGRLASQAGRRSVSDEKNIGTKELIELQGKMIDNALKYMPEEKQFELAPAAKSAMTQLAAFYGPSNLVKEDTVGLASQAVLETVVNNPDLAKKSPRLAALIALGAGNSVQLPDGGDVVLAQAVEKSGLPNDRILAFYKSIRRVGSLSDAEKALANFE